MFGGFHVYIYAYINNIMQTPVQRFESVPIIFKFFGHAITIIQGSCIIFKYFVCHADGEQTVMVKKQEKAKIPI